jgi:predicted dehydrogenase
MSRNFTRRSFIKSATLSLAALKSGAAIAATRNANEKLNLAMIGVGGRGEANFKGVWRENIVAVCDVDLERAGANYTRVKQAKQFRDYRVMFDKMHNEIDAVVISTPDHTHFHPAYAALNLDKHVYLEKPLAHSVWEVRVLTDLAREKGLATQLGVQRHAIPNMHRVVELVQSGAIGEVSEVHSWVGRDRGMRELSPGTFQVPDTLDYNLWLGPVEHRTYHPDITPYGWRFWWDFGTGETGNWGCHILDIPFWALGLEHATHVSATGPEPDSERTPQALHSVLDFPAKGDRGPVKLHWYQAKNGPPILKELNLPAEDNNTLFIGSKGMLLCGFNQHTLLPESEFEEFEYPERFIPRSPGFYREFVDACKGDKTKPTCHFDYTGPMTEAILLANNAYRTKSEFDWDHESMTCKGADAAQALIEPTFKKGWEVNA